jgi:hypothetical protein
MEGDSRGYCIHFLSRGTYGITPTFGGTAPYDPLPSGDPLLAIFILSVINFIYFKGT